MRRLEDAIDYFLFSEIKELDKNELQTKAIEALIYYKAVSPALRSSRFRVEVKDDSAYLILPGGTQVPFMKVRRSKRSPDYEVWIATDTSLKYIMSLAREQ